jgi:hypothetical protein
MSMPTDEQAQAKWLEIDKQATILMERSATEDGYRPAPKSPLAGDDSHSQPYQVSHALRMSIVSAADHLHAMCALVLRTGYLHLAAPATLARGVLECASTAIWIASPTTRDERITRALQWNIQDAKDGLRAATGAGIPVPTPLRTWKAKIEAVANKRSLPITPISGGYKSSDAVEAAEDYLKPPLGVVLPWQLASGFAHGRRWAVLAFADTMQKQATNDPGVTGLKWENDWARVLYLGLAAASVILGAVRLLDKRSAAP